MTRVLEPEEIKANDAQASLYMEEGIRLLQSGHDVDAALLCFDRALELRRRLPTEVPVHAYGLAACWLNRAEALTRFGSGDGALALDAYDEALALLRSLPLGEDARFPRRLAIACQNRALVLAAQNPPAMADATVALADAIAVLDHAEAMDARECDYLRAVVWTNLSNIQASQDTIESDLAAREAARRALALVKAHEHEDAAAAEVGLKARHVLCRIAARRLSFQKESETVMANVHDATDLADEGLSLARKWEQRGLNGFQDLASDLFRFGARVYAHYQPHFLHEFLSEQPSARPSTHAHAGSAGRSGEKGAKLLEWIAHLKLYRATPKMIRAAILALCVMGVSFADGGNFDRALSAYNGTRFDAAIAELAHPSDARSWELLGKARFMQGDFQKSAEVLEKAASLDPRSSDTQMWLGRAYGRRAETAFALSAFGYAKKSREAFERAIQIDPTNKYALGDLFDFYVAAPAIVGGGVDKARGLLPAIQRVDPAQVDFAQARIDEEEKQYGSAEAHLRREVAGAPQAVGRVLNLARFLARHGRFEESEQEFQRAEQIAPNTPRVQFAQADTWVQNKRNLDEARSLLKKYLAADNLTPDDPPRSDALKLLKKIEGS